MPCDSDAWLDRPTDWPTVTNQICSSNWLYHSRPKCVKVQNIRQFSFSSCFETTLWGEFEIRFLQQSGTRVVSLPW